MNKYKRYERYKDSGVEWIGEIPEHWNISKLKYLTYCLDEKRIPLSSEQRGEMQGDIPYWGANCIIDYVNDWIIDGEVVLLGEDGAPFFDRNKDVAFYSNEKIWPNNHVHVLRALQSINAKLLTYILNTVDYRNYINGSTRDKLTQSEMKNILIQLPSAQEQKAIANFLDQKTAEIDGLIADKEKLIELLQEKRQAKITEAVTKGLNPNVKMKDSGIEWIGEIPEHWDIRRIKYLSNIRNVKASDSDNDKIYVGLESIEPKTGKLLTNNNDEQQAVGETANIFRKGDVLFGKLRPYLAKCIVADFNGRCTSELLVLRTASDMLPEYLYLFMLSPIFIDVVNSSTYGAKMPRASWDFIGNLKIPLPNIKEQEEIVEYLIKLTNNMDDLISDISTQIQKLKEYRQSLISEAVTGKIDVREFGSIREVI